MGNSKSAIVVGSGIAGIASALRLKAKGIAVGNAIGDLIVNLQMDMPKNITDSYKSALLELNKFEQQDITPQRQLWNKKLGEYRE